MAVEATIDRRKKCDECAAFFLNVKLHINDSHPRVGRLQLIRRAQHNVPKCDARSSDHKQLLASRITNLHATFLPRFESILNDNIMETLCANNCERFERFCMEYCAKLAEFQPRFSCGSTKKSKRRQRCGENRRSEEEVNAARVTYLYRRAQFLYSEQRRKLRREIFSPETDDVEFKSDELFD